jgi:hypothetical protein
MTGAPVVAAEAASAGAIPGAVSVSIVAASDPARIERHRCPRYMFKVVMNDHE